MTEKNPKAEVQPERVTAIKVSKKTMAQTVGGGAIAVPTTGIGPRLPGTLVRV
jgi:hypothetical protein